MAEYGKGCKTQWFFIKAYILEIEQLREISKFKHNIYCDIWEPPKGDIVKINFDATYCQQSNKSISGIIIRNKGLVMASCIYPWKNILNSTMAEARACLQAVIFTEELGFREACVEGDAMDGK